MAKKKVIIETPSKAAGDNFEQKFQQKLKEFGSKDKRIAAKRKEISNLSKEITELDKKINLMKLQNESQSKISDANFLKFKKENDLVVLENELLDLHNNDDEIEYLLNTCKLVEQYSYLEERERELTSGSGTSGSGTSGSGTSGGSAIENELFQISKNKSELMNDYTLLCEGDSLKDKDLKIIYNREDFFCIKCGGDYTISESFLVCMDCGFSKPTLHLSETPSYKELQEYDYKPQFTYVKSSHFDDWLKRFQAKENTEIPQEIIDTVLLETKKERLRDLNTLTEDKVKKYLKKNGYNKYYDHVVHIIHRINGIPPFRLTPEIEDKLRKMFLQIQEPFEKYKPKTRKNFLSYSYTLHKFFQILGLPEYTRYFTLLKSPEKLRQQDEIFKKIVLEMAKTDKTIKWVFIPSI
jgi:hypothetical protein